MSARALPSVPPFAEHGGRLAAARVRYPEAPGPWLDLSTGISPWPYPVPPLDTAVWQRLPDPEDIASLCEAAREAYRAPPGSDVIPVAGTDLAIRLLPRLVDLAREVAILSPTYASHERAWNAAGHLVRRVSDVDALQRAAVAVVANPNNPDGRMVAHAELHDLAKRTATHRGLLVVDEAFADAVPGSSVLEPDADLSATVVLRSFGKFFGLAGLRLGFVITAHPIGKLLRPLLSDWPVSGPALAIGRTALRDVAWRSETCNRLADMAHRLDGVLGSAGLDVVGGTPLFRLAECSDAPALFERLATRGVLVRPFAQWPWLRFGLPETTAELGRLAEALRP
ncbi:MAG: threonine-phosphate decarboxylase CobD [Hyphomicrobium sp.]